jgi:hypothetical protein
MTKSRRYEAEKPPPAHRSDPFGLGGFEFSFGGLLMFFRIVSKFLESELGAIKLSSRPMPNGFYTCRNLRKMLFSEYHSYQDETNFSPSE